MAQIADTADFDALPGPVLGLDALLDPGLDAGSDRGPAHRSDRMSAVARMQEMRCALGGRRDGAPRHRVLPDALDW
jgi:hypothetical protein